GAGVLARRGRHRLRRGALRPGRQRRPGHHRGRRARRPPHHEGVAAPPAFRRRRRTADVPGPEPRPGGRRAAPGGAYPQVRAARGEPAARPRRRCLIMPVARTKFYQVGSFAVGNRLLPPEQRAVQASPDRANALTSGHRACRGCGEALAARWALDAAISATAGRLVVVNATGCLEVFSTPYPESSWQVSWLHSLVGIAPAVASGVAAALRAGGRDDVRVVAQGGDGGTVDIGMACLSGMFERDDDVLYICYDNQAYMNTGVQRSGATPPAARTATTPLPGQEFGQGKNVPLIAMAHEIPYVA